MKQTVDVQLVIDHMQQVSPLYMFDPFFNIINRKQIFILDNTMFNTLYECKGL